MFGFIVGIDEVGRGSLAGPVVVAALVVPENLKFKTGFWEIYRGKNKNLKIKLRDSKKLSPKHREIWFDRIKKNPEIFYVVSSAPPKVIDKINISNAANLSAVKAFKKLFIDCKLPIAKTKIFLDGGLYLRGLEIKKEKLKVKTVIKGDEKISAISLASIVAKVVRDRMMIKFHKKNPEYGFDKHKGYGTKKHFRAIKKYGQLAIHRKSFLKAVKK